MEKKNVIIIKEQSTGELEVITTDPADFIYIISNARSRETDIRQFGQSIVMAPEGIGNAIEAVRLLTELGERVQAYDGN